MPVDIRTVRFSLPLLLLLLLLLSLSMKKPSQSTYAFELCYRVSHDAYRKYFVSCFFLCWASEQREYNLNIVYTVEGSSIRCSRKLNDIRLKDEELCVAKYLSCNLLRPICSSNSYQFSSYLRNSIGSFDPFFSSSLRFSDLLIFPEQKCHLFATQYVNWTANVCTFAFHRNHYTLSYRWKIMKLP